MLYDLNVPWSGMNAAELQRTISFLSEHYTVLGLNHDIAAVPAQIKNPIPLSLPFPHPRNITFLRRCTLSISEPSQNHRLSNLAQAYDILALRPTTESAFKAACTSTEHHSLISLDLTVRYPFHFRPSPFKTARARGIKFEICYAQAVQDGGTATAVGRSAAEKRRNFISNVLAIVRATGGRGLVVSSEARSVLGVRAPADVANLLSVLGIPGDLAKEAITAAPRSLVANEGLRRRGFKGIIDVVDGGEVEKAVREEKATGKKQIESGDWNESGRERKKNPRQETNDNGDSQDVPSISKRQAKRMRLASRACHNDNPDLRDSPVSGNSSALDTQSKAKNKSKT